LYCFSVWTEEQQSVLESLDLLEEGLARFGREFVDLVQQQTQVVDALRNPQHQRLQLHPFQI
jgi:hypothetical protein